MLGDLKLYYYGEVVKDIALPTALQESNTAAAMHIDGQMLMKV